MENIDKKPGYMFAGWYIDPECTKRLNPGGILPRVMTIYDKWVPIWYPITYQLNGGTNDPANPHLVNIESEPFPLQPAVKEGSVFAGWYLDNKKITSLPSGVSHPITLSAYFREPFKIYFDSRGGGKMKPVLADLQGIAGDLPVPGRIGFKFLGWYLDKDCTKKLPDRFKISQDIQVHAGWEVENYSIEYDTQGGVNSRRNPKTYTYFDRAFELQPARKKGYRFLGWFDHRGNPLNTIPARSIGNKSLSARFEKED